MKTCPSCNRDYADDTLNFCLMCGTPLADGNAQPTVAIGGERTVTRPADPTNETAAPTVVMARTKPRGAKVVWVMLGIFVAGVALILGGLWAAGLRQGGSQNAANGPRGEAPARTPRRAVNSASPRTSPTVEPTPVVSPEETPSETPENSETTEPTPIVWSTAAMTFNGEPGQVFRFECPAGGTAGTVYGSDVYSTGSSICTAAVHAGKITLEDGGTVTIEYRAGRKLYGATTRNGVTSNTYGEFVASFVFKEN